MLKWTLGIDIYSAFVCHMGFQYMGVHLCIIYGNFLMDNILCCLQVKMAEGIMV